MVQILVNQSLCANMFQSEIPTVCEKQVIVSLFICVLSSNPIGSVPGYGNENEKVQ